MTAALPLRGRRILVTRPRNQSGKLQSALEAIGAEVIAIPTVEIVPPDSCDALDAALSDTACYDWLVLTSANAVDAIASRLRFLDIPVEALVAFEIAAIGKATADAINALGLQVELIPPRAIAESLVEALLPLVQNRNKRVLIIRASTARDVLPEALRAAGVSVTIAEAYQSIIPTASVDELQLALTAGIDAVTFTSASCVHNFVALVQKAGVQLPLAVKKISIGPVTTQAIEVHKWVAAAEAASASIDSLVAAVVQSFQVK
jgi:uroporphyrinogen-III synthase